MSRAYGWNAQLLIAEESEYGVLPDSGYRQICSAHSDLIPANLLHGECFRGYCF